MSEKHVIEAGDSMGAGLVAVGNVQEERIAPHFVYRIEAIGPVEHLRARYVALRDQIARIKGSRILRFFRSRALRVMEAEFHAIPLEQKWTEQFANTVVTGGKNSLLDVYFRAQTQITAWYVGLISSVSWSAINAADTMSSHAGWTEAGATNAPTYSQANRPALTVGSAASGGSLSSSAVSAFSITGTGTAKGAFITSNNTKDGTTGTLYSAGLFTGGDRAVINGDTINVSTTLSA